MNNKIIASKGFSGNVVGDFVFVQVVESDQKGSFRFHTFTRNVSRQDREPTSYKTTILDNCYVPFIADLLHRCRDRNDNYSVAVSELDFIARIDVNNEAMNCVIYAYQELKAKCGAYRCAFELHLPGNKGKDSVDWLLSILLSYFEKTAEAEMAEAEKEGT